MENSDKIIENLELKYVDFNTEISWLEANEKCDKLGNGWRLPTIEELKLIYFYSAEGYSVKDFDYGGWPIVWSSEVDRNFSSCAKAMFFKDYYVGHWSKNVLTVEVKGPKISTEPEYKAGKVTLNEKEYKARFIAVRTRSNH